MLSITAPVGPRRVSLLLACFGLSLLTCLPAVAAESSKTSQTGPQARIRVSVDDAQRTVLPESVSPRARFAQDTGELAPATALPGMSITFVPSATQQADLDTLLAAQQDPTSPLYHQWLTPEQFGARFGMADADLAKVQSWLQGQGFSVQGIARSRNQIFFSGTAAQASAAFRTSLHTYREGATAHFAPKTELSLPSAFAATVGDVGNLSSFRPRPHVRLQPAEAVRPNLTSSQSGNHYLTPKDVATIYDVTPAYNAGYNGAGQAIAVVGQSSVRTNDITNFQAAAGLPSATPTLVLVPNSGTPTLYSEDEGESDLDLEYTGGLAPGANILFVYTGSNANYTVFDSLTYAITERIAPIISVSYGLCEAALSTASYNTRNAVLAQAAAQGQTVVAASGDSGSTDCYGVTSLPTATQQGLAVDFPASSQYVTAMGGTELSPANAAASNTTYWASATGSDIVSSALSYIPEVVWNDDSSGTGAISLSSTGGGTSILSPRPTWQTGVPGIAAGSNRLLPDVSLLSSPVNVGYLYCSSDSATGRSGSCSNGFRDVNNTFFTVAGGTSFAAPIFAGMLAVLNQALNSTGQGVVNATLYGLAANATTYASAFHDVTSGTNGCTSGASGCSAAGAGSFAATAGYDQATGLGSVDFYKLLSAWPTGRTTGPAPSVPAATTLTLTPATATPAVSTADVITIKVAARSGATTTAPTGTVSLVVDGAAATQVTLSGGTATYSFSSAVAGVHTIVATYSGDTNYAVSTSTLVLTVGTPASTAAFSIVAPNLTVKAGSSATSSIQVVSSNGYAGTISWALAARSSVANFCYTLSNVTLATGAAQATTTLTVYTSSSVCTPTPTKGQITPVPSRPDLIAKGNGPAGRNAGGALGTTLAALFGLGLLGRKSRKLRPLLAFTVFAALGFGLAGCSNDSATSTTTTNVNTATGTYTFTLTGTDTANSALNSSTTFTITVN